MKLVSTVDKATYFSDGMSLNLILMDLFNIEVVENFI